MARLIVQASFSFADYGTDPSPAWLSLSISTEDGQPADLPFPDALHPDRPLPVSGEVLTSELWGGASSEVTAPRLVFASPSLPGIYSVEIETADPQHPSLRQLRPLSIGLVVTSGSDRGQALAYRAIGCCPDPKDEPDPKDR